MKLRFRARTPQIAGFHVLHEVAGLLRPGFGDASCDEVCHDVARLNDGENELRDLADRRDGVQISRTESTDSLSDEEVGESVRLRQNRTAVRH